MAAKKKAAKKPAKKKSAKKKSAKRPAPKRATKKVEAVPKKYGTATPHLIVSPASEALAFYEKAFGAKTLAVMPMGGDIVHAEFRIGDSILMLSDQLPSMDGGPVTRKTPKNLGGTSGNVMLFVKDVDAFVQKAVAAGATLTMPVADQFWGDRYGEVVDPFGHHWAVATHKKDLTQKQMMAAMAAMAPPG